MANKIVVIDGNKFVEIAGTMVPEEYTKEYMEQTIPNREELLEEERKAIRASWHKIFDTPIL